MEFKIAQHKSVLAQFPNARITSIETYSDKIVNKTYTNFEFKTIYQTLYVMPYCIVDFTFENKDYQVKVHSQPTKNKLCYKSWRLFENKRVIKFSRYSFNQKNNQFKEEMLNSCRGAVMKFIANNPGCHLDDKHLEPRLKKLIYLA